MMLKPVMFTRHALVRMDERGLPRAAIEAVARAPLWTEPEPADPAVERRFGRISADGERFLRVVCVETDDMIRVITATLDRGARRPR
jgi:uncharacterized DUF497 family protein